MQRTAYLFVLTAMVASSLHAQHAIRFDAPGAYLEVPHSPSLASPEFTVEFWLRVNDIGDVSVAGGEQTLFDKRDGTGGGYNFRLAGDRFPLPLFAIVEPIGVAAFGHIDRYRWMHVAVVQSADSLKVYVGAEPVAADTNRTSAPSTAPLRIGEFLGFPGIYLGLRGDMDEVRIWSHPRPVDSLRAYLHRTLSGDEPGLAAYWDFENESDRKIPDLSPNGNEAYLYGEASRIPSDAPVDFVPPPPPSCLRALAATASIELAWQPPGQGVGQLIYRGSSPDFDANNESQIASVPGTDSVFIDHNVVPGFNYYYRLRSVDELGHPGDAGNPALARVLVEMSYLTGTYYLAGFDPSEPTSSWDGTYLRSLLDPPQPPLLGQYSSRDLSVIQQHLDWMQEYGIDFLVADWLEPGSREDVTLRDYLLPELQSTPIQLSLIYRIDKFWGDQGLVIDADIRTRMLQDFEYMADIYFDHPSILRIDGRTVVFIYGSRHLQGDFIGAFAAVREAMEDHGHDLFLIGDEFRWNVTDPDHFQYLDAVTPYLMGTWRYRGNYLGQTEFFADLSQWAGRWEEAAHPYGNYVVPSVSPGVNLRPSGSASVTPRHIMPDLSSMTAFEAQIRLLRPFVDPHLKMIMINSWNDWTADRQIEPTVISSPTDRDISDSGSDYTTGFTYEAYGTEYLETVRRLLAPELLVGVADASSRPLSDAALFPGYPNPAGGRWTMEFDVPETAEVELSLYDAVGRRIRVVPLGLMTAGRHVVEIEASDLASGLYGVRLVAGREVRYGRIVVAR